LISFSRKAGQRSRLRCFRDRQRALSKILLIYYRYGYSAFRCYRQQKEFDDMWGGIIGLIIQLIAGGVGGNIAGSALKQYDLGTIGNTIAGVIGGGVGAQIIGALLGGGAGAAAGEAGGLDIGSIIGQIASGGVGGSILMVIVGLIKQAMSGKTT
jgi:hypothetical protein